jgi:hypothetical protein
MPHRCVSHGDPSSFSAVAEEQRHPVGVAEAVLDDLGINRLRFDVAQELLSEGARLVDETAQMSISGAKLLLAVQGTRAIHIFESVIVLCRIGRGVPASMLNRALLEEALDAYWITAHPDLAPARADEHERLLVLAERSMEQEFGRPGAPLSAAERTELSSLRRRYSNFRAPWTLASDQERIGLIKQSWGVAAADHIEYVYQVIQRQNNALLHPSPLAYSLEMLDGRRGINRLGPDGRWRDALAHGALGFYLIIRVLAAEFGFDKAGAERLFAFLGCLSHTFSDEELRCIPRGSACPCGSGRVVERCHYS